MTEAKPNRWPIDCRIWSENLLIVLNRNLTNLLCLDDPSEDQKEEFLHEIEQMKLLGSHQNIVSLVGCCTLQEHKFLVIEYVPFGDLLQWLRRRRRSVRRFPKKYLNDFILPQVFGSNVFHGY